MNLSTGSVITVRLQDFQRVSSELPSRNESCNTSAIAGQWDCSLDRNLIPLKVQLCPQEGILWANAVWFANTSSLNLKIVQKVPANSTFLITVPASASIRYAGPGIPHNTTSLTIETDEPQGPVFAIPFIVSPAMFREGNFTHARVSFYPARSQAGDVISLAGEFVATMPLNLGDDLTLILSGFVGPCSVLPCANGTYRTGCSLASRSDSFCRACTFRPPPDSTLSIANPFDADACSFQCDPGFYRDSNNSRCKPCNTDPCPAGLYRYDCGVGEVRDAMCVSCSNVSNGILLQVP